MQALDVGLFLAAFERGGMVAQGAPA